MRILAALALLAIAAPQVACAGKRLTTPDAVTNVIAAAPQDRAAAAAALDAAATSLSGQDREMAQLYAAEQHRLMGHAKQARERFTRLAAESGRGAVSESCRLGVALLDAAASPGAVTGLRGVSERNGLDTQNADRFLFLAIDAASRDDVDDVREFTRKALSYSLADAAVKKRIEARIKAISAGGAAPVAHDRSPIDEAEAKLAAGKVDAARQAAQAIIDDDPDGDDGLAARYLIERIDAGTVVYPDRIGVLLPLSGRYAAVGKQLREALELGYGRAATSRRLIFQDTGETAESAIAAVEKLALQEGVIAVVGPVRRDFVDEVATAGNALRLPMLSLAAVSAAADRDWVWDGVVTVEAQTETLAEFAIHQRGMKAFAIFAPDNDLGHLAAAAFRRAVEARGAQITAEGFYPYTEEGQPDPEGTRKAAEILGKKDYASRGHEFEEIKREIKKRGGNPKKAVLPPVLDFDALFVPENKASHFPMAAGMLAQEEFPMGHYVPVKDGPQIPLLGLNGWNTDYLITNGGPYLRDSLFTDAWFPEAAADAWAEEYKNETGRTPKALEAGMYSAGQALAALARVDAKTRPAMNAALATLEFPVTVTGAGRFAADTRRLAHRIRVLTIDERDGIVPADVQPEEPEAPVPEAPGD